MITTGIVLSNFKGFTRRSSLDLLAQEMSLVIRQAQVYGTATKVSGPTDPADRNSFGVEFDLSSPNNFLLLSIGNDGDILSTVETFNLTGGARIKSVEGCNDEDSCSSLPSNNKLKIGFPRPTPGASFYTSSNGNDWNDQTYSSARITIEDTALAASNASSTKSIRVWNTGHIYVESVLNK